jgi:SHS2 domain-containing protein
MSYEWKEHTGELELQIQAPTEEAVFEEALQALEELLGDEASEELVSREVAVKAEDRGALLAQWIEELVYLAETDDLLPTRVTAISFTTDGLIATVNTRLAKPRHLVKAATYHRLEFEPSDGGYCATVVLDV